jgi:mono/diheme cytochrome c family protein
MTISGSASRTRGRRKPRRGGAFFCAVAIAFAIAAETRAGGDPRRGEYLAQAAGCAGCHTGESEGSVPFTGGRALKTPFGTFYGPNITPHPEAGIGRWSEADFRRALRYGERPDRANYYPAFPYTSFTHISDDDLRDLYSYLRSLPPSDRASRPHELGFVYRWRFLLTAWKWLFFTPGPVASDPQRDAVTDRGRYLVDALGHCTECHTPRNALGALRTDGYLAGGAGPEGKRIPNITPTRLKKWSDAELKDFLLTGDFPDGDAANATMTEVVRNTTSKLTPGDLQAMIAYLRSVPALPEAPKK